MPDPSLNGSPNDMPSDNLSEDASRELTARYRRAMARPARVFNLIGMGDPDRLRETLEFGADPNCQDRGGRPALVRAICGRVVEASVVRALLEAGADPSIAGPDGLTPLDRARRRLLKYEGRPRTPPRRSRSLTAGGDVKLHPFENRALDRMRETHPDIAEEFEAEYLNSRRKAAERIFDTPGNLEKIVTMLEAAEAGEPLP